MQLGIVDASGEKLADAFESIIFHRVEQVIFKKKTALDLFDALAFLKQFEKMDQRLVIIKLKRDEDEREEAFFSALANLEATTGKIVFKCIYYDDESGKDAIKTSADQFLEYLFKVKPKNEEAQEDDILPDVDDPEFLIK